MHPHSSLPAANTERHNSSPWSKQDDQQLLQARQQGLNWAPIASTYFPTKTPNACRKRHERLIEKMNNRDSWDNVKLEALAKTYLDIREQMWTMLGERMGEKWHIVEAKVSDHDEPLF